MRQWYRVVGLVQTAFRYGILLMDFTWQAIVLLAKGGVNFRGIGLMQLLWNTVPRIINCCIGAAIN